ILLYSDSSARHQFGKAWANSRQGDVERWQALVFWRVEPARSDGSAGAAAATQVSEMPTQRLVYAPMIIAAMVVALRTSHQRRRASHG
ncbi:MAG TPA: hypothetical protein VE482_02205, partial [Candidatus Eisenbacteria bacterium]|nr:hypothetical protein [Candidatus Eisenbacteria bacterium]